MARSATLTPVLLASIVALCCLPEGLLFAVPQGKPRHSLTSHVARGLEQRTPQAGGRARPARRVMTVAEPPKMMNEEPPRHWLWGAILSCLWPLACVTFLSDAKMLNGLVQKFPPVFGIAIYLGLSSLFWGFARSGIFAKSARALVQTTCKALKKLGVAEWRTEVLGKAASPLANVTEGCLVFLAFNFLVNALPDGAVFNLPRIATFMNINHEGLLATAEIEQWTYNVASRLLMAWATLQGALFVTAAKEAPASSIENPQSLIAKFFNGLQRLQGMNHKTGQHSVRFAQSHEALLVQTVDKAIDVAAWGSAFYIWAHLAGLRFGTILAIGGAGGLAISLAAKNIVQNLISGALIFANRTLVVGDEIDTAGIKGFVDEIGATNTVIYTHNGEPLIVPNSKLVDNSIVNVQRREFWLIEQACNVNVKGLDLVPEVLKTLQETLEKKVAPLQTSPFPGKHHVYQEPLVFLEDMAGGVSLKFRAYVDGSLDRHEFYKAKQDVLLAMYNAAHSLDGVKFSFEGGFGGPPQYVLVEDKPQK